MSLLTLLYILTCSREVSAHFGYCTFSIANFLTNFAFSLNHTEIDFGGSQFYKMAYGSKIIPHNTSSLVRHVCVLGVYLEVSMALIDFCTSY